MKWRLMTHKEMENDYRFSSDARYDTAYITRYPENHHDPLYSVRVYDENDEQHNTNLAISICRSLNTESNDDINDPRDV